MTPADRALVERINRTPLYPLAAALGFRLLELDAAAGTSRCEFAPGAESCNAFGTVHGGAITAMLDLCSAVAGIGRSGLTQAFPSLEIKTSFIAPLRPGRVIGCGRVLRLGRTVAFLEGRLDDGAGALAACASITARVIAFDWSARG
jgi:uncharacterized protein (TIGR00369 family)